MPDPAARSIGRVKMKVMGRPKWEYGSRALFLVVVTAATLPMWWVPYPPMQDMPQHLAAVRVLHSLDDPAYGMAQYFALHLGTTQYLAYYLLCHWLSFLTDITTANLILVTLTLVGIPYGARSLLKALGGEPLLALLLVPLTYNAHLILGFLNFLAAVPLLLFGLAMAVRQRARPTRLRGGLLSVTLLLCFYMHVVPCALLGVGVGLLALRRPWRASFVGLSPLLPLGVAGITWLVRSPAGKATTQAAGLGSGGGSAATFRPLDRALSELPMWLTDVRAGDEDLFQLKCLVGLIAVAWVVGIVFPRRGPLETDARRRSGGRSRAGTLLCLRLAALPLLCLLGYVYLPSGYQWIWPIAERFALLALVLAVPLLPALRTWLCAPVVACAVLLSVLHIEQTAQAFVAFDAEVGQFDAALNAIPKGKRVAGLIFDRGSRHIRFAPFLHYVAHYQAQKGGAVMFTFADFPQSPFSFHPGNRPPRVQPRWEWTPGRVRPRRELSYYDYVLVRGGPGRVGGRNSGFVQVFQSRHWRVFKAR